MLVSSNMLYGTRYVHVRKLRLKHSFSEAKQEIPPRNRLLGFSHHHWRTYPGFRGPQWHCAGGWNVMMVREKHRARPIPGFLVDWRRYGMASGIDQREAFQRMKPVLSWWTSIPDEERQAAGDQGNEDTASPRPAPRYQSSRGRTRSLLGSRFRRKDARLPSFWRWRGRGFGFSPDRQWGCNLVEQTYERSDESYLSP